MKCPHCGKDIGKPLSIMDLKDIITAAKSEVERLENNHSRMSPHGLVWDTKESFDEWRAMKKTIRDTNRKIAML